MLGSDSSLAQGGVFVPLCSLCAPRQVTAAAPLLLQCSDQDKTTKQVMGFVVTFFDY